MGNSLFEKQCSVKTKIKIPAEAHSSNPAHFFFLSIITFPHLWNYVFQKTAACFKIKNLLLQMIIPGSVIIPDLIVHEEIQDISTT